MQHPNELPYALDYMHTLKSKLATHSLAIFLDYDGTLTPIVSHPELALLPEEIRQLLSDLSQHTMLTVISGRSKSNLKQLVRLKRIFYAGNHGFSIEAPTGIEFIADNIIKFLPLLYSAYQEIYPELASIPGTHIEFKQLSFAIHYRQVDGAYHSKVIDLVTQLVNQHLHLKKISGKKVIEVCPNIAWDKGKALHWIQSQLEEQALQPIFIIYLGDDLTDEYAFQVLPTENSMSILVGNHGEKTWASYALPQQSEVEIFLRELTVILKENPHDTTNTNTTITTPSI